MLMLLSALVLINSYLVAGNISLTLNQASETEYTSQCGEYTYFEVDFPYPCQDLNITVNALAGNPEIYASKTLIEPKKRDLTWTAVKTDHLVIDHYDPESSPGMYYIGIYANCLYEKTAATFKIAAYATNSTFQESDIYLNSSISHNKIILEENYLYYHFCVPQCADVIVSLQNCLSYEQCNDTYSYPELLVTRLQTSPTIYDYTYKLASVTRRNVTVSHRDPMARDKNGYMTGSYYVGVYGWCTPDNQVIDWQTDGPCSYAARTVFNVTVQLIFSMVILFAMLFIISPTFHLL